MYRYGRTFPGRSLCTKERPVLRFGLWEAHADAYMKRFLAGEITYAEFSRLDALEWKMRQLRKTLTVTTAETWAVGDNWGDIEMLQEAGRAFLVASGPECRERVVQAVPHVECIPDLCHLVSLIQEVSVGTV